MVALLNFHTDASYKTILEQFTSHGKIDVRVAPYLFPLLSDEPLLGLAPSEDSQAQQDVPNGEIEKREERTKPSETTFSLSTVIHLLQKNSSADKIQSARTVEELRKTLEVYGEENLSEELVGRAKSAIKIAYEQTTDPFAFLRELVTNAYEASRNIFGQAAEFHIRTFMNSQKQFVLSMEDQGKGMGLSDILTKLLLPELAIGILNYFILVRDFYRISWLRRSADPLVF